MKDDSKIIGFRPTGHTDILSKTKNYNFTLERETYSSQKYGFILFCVLLSFIPFGIFVLNAEGNFRRANVKGLTSKRRERLDLEHGVNRQALQSDYADLDKQYRLTEKDEIKKYLEIGKTPQQYYDEQSKIGRLPGGGKSSEIVERPTIETIKETFLKREDGLKV